MYLFLENKHFYSQFKDIPYTLWLWFPRDPDGSRVKECLILQAQRFPSTGMSEVIYETLAHLQVSTQTSMKSLFEFVSHYLLLNLAYYICFPLKGTEKSSVLRFRFNSQCHMMPSHVWGLRGGVYVCVCVEQGSVLGWRGEKESVCLWEVLPDVL